MLRPPIDCEDATMPGQFSSLLIVRFFSYFPALGLALLPVGVAAQAFDHAGRPSTPIASVWVPDDSSEPWRDVCDRALAAGATDLAALAEAWGDTLANGVTADCSVQAVILPHSAQVEPDLASAAVDLLYWQILIEHCVLSAEAEGLGLLAE